MYIVWKIISKSEIYTKVLQSNILFLFTADTMYQLMQVV